MKMTKRIVSTFLSVMLMLSIVMTTGIESKAAKQKNAAIDASQYAAVFDAAFYANQYPDLKVAYGNDANLLFNHFYNCGMAEGRQGSAEFNVQAYMNRYADLKAAYGNDLKKYYIHYITAGKAEGRNGKADNQATVAPANPYANAYNIMISFKASYPEGRRYTNDDFYKWNGGIYYGGYGCAGFAFMLSDAVFGTNKARIHYDITAIRVGDILRINNNTHSVIVLEVNGNGVVVAEANYNSSVHWGRTFSWGRLYEVTDYVMTRYPN